MIESVTWRLGGHNNNAATSQAFYNAERGTTVPAGAPSSWSGHVGLLYPSDYGFSVRSVSCVRTTNLSVYGTLECGSQSWLFHGGEWFLTPFPTSANEVFIQSQFGNGALITGVSSLGFVVRPTLYLKSEVMYLAGEGTESNPHVIICPSC